MGTSWISRKGGILEKGGGDLEKGGMNPLTTYDYLEREAWKVFRFKGGLARKRGWCF